MALTNAQKTDAAAAQSPSATRARIAAIFRNRGMPLPSGSTMTALESNVQRQGFRYFDTIRADPERYLRLQRSEPRGNPDATSPEVVPPTLEEDARRQRQANTDAMRALLAWLPRQLLDVYIREWVKHGDGQLAWAVVRTDPLHEQFFPGIKRDDGSLRMTEQDFISHREAFDRELVQNQLNPEFFRGFHEKLVRGEVSAPEFRQRIQAKVTGILQNLPQVRAKFGQFFGIDGMSDEALVAAALEPSIGLDLLQGRITAAQVAGEAAVAGFQRGRERSELLVQAGGLDQVGARQLFSAAATAVPRFGRFAERFNDQDPFTVEQFEDASVFADADERQRMRRLEASETALFNRGGQVARDRTGLAGLRQR